MQPFQGFIQLFQAGEYVSLSKDYARSSMYSQRTTKSISPRLHENSFYGEMTLLPEWKQTKKKSVDEIMTVPAMENRSTEAMLGHCVTSIFFGSTRSER